MEHPPIVCPKPLLLIPILSVLYHVCPIFTRGNTNFAPKRVDRRAASYYNKLNGRLSYTHFCVASFFDEVMSYYRYQNKKGGFYDERDHGTDHSQIA